MATAVGRPLTAAHRARPLERLRRRAPLPPGRLRHRSDAYRALVDRLDRIDAERGTRGNRLFYLATPPSAYAGIVEHLGKVGLDREQRGGGWSRIVIEKPFGHDLDQRARPQPRRAARLRRVAGLSHRPLPGQGDRPQHPGLPLRQRHLRAGLEPALHRPRADHRGRGPRRRGSRRLLRGGRRDARHPPEPRPAAAQRWWPWSRPSPSRPTRCATRSCGSCVPSTPTGRPTACGATWSAASTPPAGSADAQGAGLPRRARGRRGLADRHLRRPAPRGPELALGGRALLPADRQAPAQAGHRRSPSSSSGRR